MVYILNVPVDNVSLADAQNQIAEWLEAATKPLQNNR